MFSRLLATRYLNPRRSHVSAITLISLVGVMLGVMVLIVVLSIHAGFERNVKQMLLGFSPHLEVHSPYGFIQEWEPIEEKVSKESGVVSAFPIIQDYVLIDSPSRRTPVFYRAFDTDDQAQVQALTELLDLKAYPGGRADMGIDEYAVISRQLAKEIGLQVGDEIEVYASQNFDTVKKVFEETSEDPLQVTHAEQIAAVRAELAELRQEATVPIETLQAFYGKLDELYQLPSRDAENQLVGEAMLAIESEAVKDEENGIYQVPESLWNSIDDALTQLVELDIDAVDAKSFKNIEELVLPKKLTIWGVYADTQRAQGPQLFIPLNIGRELSGIASGTQAIAVRLEDPYHAFEARDTLQELVAPDYQVVSWMDRHAAQFMLMKTEKVMMTFALSFIGLVAAFSIMAVMYTFTIQKKQEIGVMKALGARNSQISWVFLWQGLVIGFFGGVGGILLALLILWRRLDIQRFLAGLGVDPFPADFQGFDELPAEYLPGTMIIVALAAWFLCALASFVPAIKAARNDAAKSLRNL
ncbi:MAG: FtsX-like permease family protein [Verrucomicrobiota bacterium JB023]|nr:FtsX-like permease family protein [Verrucomicrobiota bacterium JB023]